MTTLAPDAATTLDPDAASAPEVIYRHTFLVRLTHWLNALAIFVLIGSGLDIFNAHPRLYWGRSGDMFDRPILFIHAARRAARRCTGSWTWARWRLDTTGVLGWSRQGAAFVQRAWPDWITIPSGVDLADARHWHFLFAWVLAINALVYLVWSLSIRHLQRDLWPRSPT